MVIESFGHANLWAHQDKRNKLLIRPAGNAQVRILGAAVTYVTRQKYQRLAHWSPLAVPKTIAWRLQNKAAEFWLRNNALRRIKSFE